MDKIRFPRIDQKGKQYDKQKLREWYLSQPEIQQIKTSLKSLKPAAKDYDQRYILKYLNEHFDEVMAGDVDTLNQIVSSLSKSCNKAFPPGRKRKGVQNLRKKNNFKANIVKCFNYDEHRYNKTNANSSKPLLIRLIEKLNVTSCPYCNHEYVLNFEYKVDNKQIAALELDHFFDKGTYPFLALSLFNLIPSCHICNNRKLSKSLPVSFSPYRNSDEDVCSFSLNNRLDFLMNEHSPSAMVELKTENSTISKDDLTSFCDTLLIKERYSCHVDIIKEIYYKTYLEPYYCDKSNFTSILPDDFDPLKLLYGYTDVKDINLRPLTKFTQDIRKEVLNKSIMEDESI